MRCSASYHFNELKTTLWLPLIIILEHFTRQHADAWFLHYYSSNINIDWITEILLVGVVFSLSVF